MLGVLLIIGGLVPLTQEQDIKLHLASGKENCIITGRFLDSLLLSTPPCSYAGEKVELNYVNVKFNKSYTLSNAFTVPQCDTEDPKGSTALSRNIGYQLMNLNHSTQYKIYYKIGFRTSNLLMTTTQEEASYTDISLRFPGRSAAMIVITVILSVAMFILLVSIIISMAQGCCGI